MAHTLLFSGYGAPGCDDLAVCRLTADGTLETLSTLRHGRAPSFCCRGQNGWIYAASERADGADVTAYRKGPYKIHLSTSEFGGKPGIVKHDPPLLFDLEKDPSEQFNVAIKHPEVVADLLKDIAAHKATVQAVPDQLEPRIPATQTGG